MKIFTLPTIRAAPSSEEEATIPYTSRVGACKALVTFNVTSRLGFRFAGSPVRNTAEKHINRKELTLNSCLLYLLLPICCTRYLDINVSMLGKGKQKLTMAHCTLCQFVVSLSFQLRPASLAFEPA